MLIKIYHNEGPDHFFGFRNDFANRPELKMVYSFEITEVFAYQMSPKWYMADKILEWIFKEFNVGESYYAKEYRAKGLRSLSVGDVVSLGENAWSVESAGWNMISGSELQNAMVSS